MRFVCSASQAQRASLVCASPVWQIYSVSQKVAPIELFALFSFMVDLCYWKKPWLLPKHILMFTPILLAHLSEVLYELYHFY